MTKFEKYFVKVHHILNEIGLDHWLIGSSLLGSFREGRIIKGDKEVNFGVMAVDMILSLPKLKEHFKIITTPTMFRTSGIYLVDKDYCDDLWNHPIGFTWLAPHHLSGNKICQMITKGHILYWDKELLNPITPHQFLGDVFSIPANPQKWLSEYFGDDWKTPNKDWSWKENAINHINVEALC